LFIKKLAFDGFYPLLVVLKKNRFLLLKKKKIDTLKHRKSLKLDKRSSASSMGKVYGGRLPPEVNRIVYVRNLPYSISSQDMYDIFGKYGAIRQIRIGDKKNTKGTAFVVYEDIYDAKSAVDHLTGFNVAGRYLVVLYYKAPS